MQESLTAGERWIIDGNYLGTLDLRLRAADTVVFLDLPVWRCAWRATLRLLRGHGRANTAPGCPERLGARHLRFLRYIWRFPRAVRPQLLARLPSDRAVFRLTTPSQVRLFLLSAPEA